MLVPLCDGVECEPDVVITCADPVSPRTPR
jgi:hypothetical protein